MVAKLKIDGRQMSQVAQNWPFCLMISFTITAATLTVLPPAIYEFLSILSLIYSFIILYKWKRKNNSKGKRSHVFLVTLALLWMFNTVQVQIFCSSCLSIEFREPIELGFHPKSLSSNPAHFSEYFHCDVLWIFVCEWHCYINQEGGNKK